MSESTPPPTRRSFFAIITYLMGAAAAVFTAIPFLGYLFGALRKPEAQWVDLGAAAGFPVGETRLVTFDNPIREPWDGMTAQTGVHVRNKGERIVDGVSKPDFDVFAINCTHLGCPVTWFPQSGLFMCPCHGGVYYENGDHASGPPPRGLYHCVWQIEEGNLRIQAPHLPTLQDTLTKKDA